MNPWHLWWYARDLDMRLHALARLVALLSATPAGALRPQSPPMALRAAAPEATPIAPPDPTEGPASGDWLVAYL